MAAAKNEIPNMNRQTAPAIRPERMFLRASFLSMAEILIVGVNRRHEEID
jgi:hypothetical protein